MTSRFDLKQKFLKLIPHPMTVSLVLALSAIFSVCSTAANAEQEAMNDKPIEINGESVEYFYEQERAVGKGDVRIEYGGWTLTADEVEVDMKAKEASARGNVTLVQEGAIYKGESVLVNFANKTAQISKLRAALAPSYFGRGQTVHKEIDGHYVIDDGYVTTCDDTECNEQEMPYYRIQAKRVLFYPNDKIVIHHAILRIGNIPVFYVPIIVVPILEMDRFPIQVEAGRRKEWGAYALTRARYYFNKDFKGNVLFDVRENQKFAGGFESFYNTHAYGQGAARAYYADDRCGETDIECSPSESHLSPESSRYRAQLRHRWQMFPDTAMNMEINKLSDEFIIQDFFEQEEYEANPFPDNYVSIIQSKDDYTLSGLARYRLDDFVGVVERMPEVRFDTHTHAFEGTPFYWREEVQASQLSLRHKDEEDSRAEATRADLRHTLSYVHKMEPWTITPFVATRETYYSRDIVGEDSDFVRWNLESGVDASTKFFKVYDVKTNAMGMDVNDLRHIVTPAISYRYQSQPTHFHDTLYQFDSIDALDHQSFFRFELQNKLQTKSHNPGGGVPQARKFLRVLAFADLLMPQADESRLDRIVLDVEFDPYRWLTLSADTEYFYESDQFETANLDVVLNRDPFWVGFGQRYVNGGSNQTTAQVDWNINSNWSVRAYERFEFADIGEGQARTDEFEAVVERRNFLCWTVRLTFNYRDGGSAYVSFSPTAYPETTFRPGQTYRTKDPFIPTSGAFVSPEF